MYQTNNKLSFYQTTIIFFTVSKLMQQQQRRYLDIPVSLCNDHSEKLWFLEMINEIRVERMEVVFNASTLHD